MAASALQTPDEIQAMQDRLVRRMLRLAHTAHPAYRERWRAAGIDPLGISEVAELDRLPLTTKADYTSAPEAYRLEAASLSQPEATLWDVMYTTGTSTGRPAPFFTTTYDYYNTLELQRRVCAIRGIGPTDVIANLYPLTPYPHGAFTRCSQAAAAIGAALVVGGNGRSYGPHAVHRGTDEVVEVLVRSQPTVLWGVASYLRRLLSRADQLGARLTRVRMCAVSGEPVPDVMREELRAALGALGSPGVTVNDSLGATEMQAGLIECREGSGLHNPAPDLFYLEAVDEDGRSLPAGTPGSLALTHLDRRGTVLFRYLTGDVVTLADDPCPFCGRAGGRVVSRPRRTGRLTKIRGTLVDIDAIVGAVARVPGSGEFQVRVTGADPRDPATMETLHIDVVTSGGAGWPALGERIRTAVKAATNLSPEVRPVALSELELSEGEMKTRRFIDRRDA